VKTTRLLVFAAVMASLCLAASAQTSVIFTDNDGTFTFDEHSGDATYDELALGGISNGLGQSGTLTAISGLAALGVPNAAVPFNNVTDTCTPACLGTITLNTGTIASGSILSSATFNPGGNFMVSYGSLGVSFSGTFSSASWKEISTNVWVFDGTIMGGTLTVGSNTYTIQTAATVQLTTVGGVPSYHTNKETYTFSDSGGTTNFSIAPEPGSLALFGSGLIVVGLLTRRRLSAKGASTQG